jgi:predicted ATP-dependent endonuclease of OLD family
MRIDRIVVHHFRCLEKCALEFSEFTALVGPNGVGKSTLLESLRYFFNPKYSLNDEDVNPNCSKDPIGVSVRFSHLTARERELYGQHLSKDAFEVTKVSVLSDDEGWSSRYEVDDFALPAFDEIRKVRSDAGAIPARRAFNDLVTAHPPYGFTTVASITEAEDQMRKWEVTNEDKCARRPGHFDFSPKGGTSLARCTQLVYIPAVRDAKAEMEGAKSPLQELLDSVVFSEIELRPEFTELIERFQREYMALFPPENVPELDKLAGVVTSYLSSFAPGSKILLAWDQDAAPNIGAPEVKAVIVEDDYPGDVSHKGHGVQRAVIVALVHALNMQRTRDLQEDEEPEPGQVVPDLLLVIEEPELYQHPTRARHFSEALRSLVTTTSENARIQVVISTHSPYFVTLAHFESVRLLRRKHVAGKKVPNRTVGRTTLTNVARELGASFSPAKAFTAESLAPRLHGILDNALREGFFADSIVLVEGDQDQALIAALCRHNNFDHEAAGLAILPVNGKNSLDKALVIFRQLGIPTYVMFDGDKKRLDHQEANPRLLRLLGAEAENTPATIVTATYAVHEENLEITLTEEFGAEFKTTLRAVADEYGYVSQDSASKVPVVMEEVLKRLATSGKRSKTLTALFENIRRLATEHRQANVA